MGTLENDRGGYGLKIFLTDLVSVHRRNVNFFEKPVILNRFSKITEGISTITPLDSHLAICDVIP